MRDGEEVVQEITGRRRYKSRRAVHDETKDP